MINLSQKQSDAWRCLEDDETTEIGFGGAAGPGKSYLGCLWKIYRRNTYPGTRGIIGRAKLSRLKESTLVTYFKACGDLGYKSEVHYHYNAQDHLIMWANGSIEVFKDLFLYPSDPDFTSLGSTEYTDAFIDEGTEISLKAFEILNSRLRWMLNDFGLIPKTLITCNPAPGWVKRRFISDDEGKPIVLKPYQKFIHALVTDNPNPEFVKLYTSQLEKITSEYDRRRLLYGDWDARREVVRPFARQFDRKKHVSERAKFDPKKLIYITLDFNLDPFGFIFEHKWYDAQGAHRHQFDEGKIKGASLDEGLSWIKTKYGKFAYNFVVTGDKMGDRRDFGERDNASYYKRIQNYFNLRDNQIETHANPSHENSRDDVNYVLYHFPDDVIHPNCRETISDLENVEVDSYGRILKADRKNENQRADFLDCKRYSTNDHFMQTWIRAHQRMT